MAPYSREKLHVFLNFPDVAVTDQSHWAVLLIADAIMDTHMMEMFDRCGIVKGKVLGFQWKL